jgi:hypothetical protein
VRRSANPNVKFLAPKDEWRHPRGDETTWQESVVMHWYDADAGVGGYHRIGHEPNHDGGRAVAWSMVFDRDGYRYKRDVEMPLTEQDQADKGFGVGQLLRFICDPHPTWQGNDETLSFTLECRDFLPPIDTTSDFSKDLAQGHAEAVGRVTGSLRRNGREIAISGFAWRDHSWGPRDWSGYILNHRWITGTCGPKMSFFALTVQDARGGFHPSGFIVREDQVQLTRDFDVQIYMESDGLTHRGGELEYFWGDGTTTKIRFRALDGALFRRGTFAVVDILCEAHWNGETGYCDAEISTNPRLGVGPISVALNANLVDGFTHRPMRRGI